MSEKTIELISFNLCPFVQRSVITLKKKGIDFKITYIDLADKPDWFLAISPLGKVPVVKYGDDVLFESAVINEFIDEITPNQIMPSDPLQKAKDRGWIEFSSQIIMNQYMLSVAKNADDFESQKLALVDKLTRLESTIQQGGFFNGTEFSLIDAAVAPMFTRLDIIKKHFNHDLLINLPKLQALANNLVSQPYVKASVIDDFENVFVQYLKGNESYLAA
ncbi:MAG: glutathione S-transferase family protein [Aliivibrio sp.]|uniref:glutathione S-transferase family protein n=1 Tax=Aliivibrio sp. TaxID=1872443 RepID=UPI001A543524|nr:glutathione S-transferase family protein [Aliivibrio sp.]